MTARIVVIDNDKAIRESLTIRLRAENWQSFDYLYADIDLLTIKQLQPDLIILNCNIQDGTEWQFLQILKMEAGTSSIPILLTTTSHVASEVQGYLLAQDVCVVNRPFDLDAFLPLVQKMLMLASHTESTISDELPRPILVVEDSQDLQEALATILRLEGYEVVTADNGLLALEALSKADHCLIFLDIRMPVMDGIEFLRVYEQQQKTHTPVVILSGEADIMLKGFPSFVVEVVPKPYAVGRLLSIAKKAYTASLNIGRLSGDGQLSGLTSRRT